MQVSMSQLFIGVLMWSLVMALPSLISYFKDTNPTLSLILLTSLYPTILAHLSRSGSFWVSYPVIMISSAIALTISLALVYLFKTKNTIVLTTVPIVTFAVAMGLLSTKMNMYNNAVTSNY
jgi:hypothetical protein